ncbi:MAG: sigma-70 family RNA polymerase sigma factor [Ruminococcaceae bacterium]|nr:sigma-70 family RNA polymerase sigma factor [Oscillospiraceae bacterium]
MFSELLGNFLNQLLFITLHLNVSSSFPPPLSASEERDCLKLMKEGDVKAKQKLIEHNLRLVAHIIKKYYSNYCDQEDLISIGTIGLIKGINSFDVDKGARLATYAARCIENEILMHFRAAKKTSHEVFMSDPIESDSDGDTLTLMDVICSDDNLLDEIDMKIKCEKLHEILKNMKKGREYEILVLRYGLSGEKPLTQREIAKKMKISRSYVSRLEKKGIDYLREQFGVI